MSLWLIIGIIVVLIFVIVLILNSKDNEIIRRLNKERDRALKLAWESFAPDCEEKKLGESTFYFHG